jgi:two-component system OmpR family response regulator
MTAYPELVRLLVVEDDERTADFVRRALARQGYAVDVVRSGEEALWALAEHPYRAVVLDAMIPAPDGFDVVRRLRADENWIPVLMLTARDAVADRVRGLDVGADDYLTKPFALDELFARVRALVRRAPQERPAALVVGDLELDPSTHTVRRAGQLVELTPKGFALLEHLMRHAGEVVTRSELIDHVWDEAYDGASNVVDAYVSRVRDAVDKPFETALIETVRGVGYRLRAVPPAP